MEVILYYGARKRDNSTLVPTGGTSFYGTLKEECDMLSPSILFDMGNSNPSHYTMAYIPDFGRYYFCDWQFRGSRHWWCNMSIDVLASWKSSIGVSDLYVLRSAQERDYYLPDNKYPMKTNAQYFSITQQSPFAQDLINGSFVLACVGGYNGSGASCGVTYYWITMSALQDLFNRMYNNNGITDDWTQLFEKDFTADQIPLKLFVDPAQYVIGCLWLPYISLPSSGVATTVKFGYFNSTAGALTLTQNFVNAMWVVDYSGLIPTAATTEFWKYYAPYSEYELYLPVFGTLKIDAATLIGNSDRKIYVNIETSIYTGDSTAILTCGGNYIGKMAANVAIPIQVGGAKMDVQGLVHSAVNLVDDIVSLVNPVDIVVNPVDEFGIADTSNKGKSKGIGKTAVDALDTFAKYYTPKVSTAGTQGSNSDMHSNIALVRRYLEPAEQDPTHYGYPLCKIKRISSLAGFIKVADGDVECSATQTEKEMMRQLLESGFYYE